MAATTANTSIVTIAPVDPVPDSGEDIRTMADDVYKYGSPIIIITGLVGNILTICVLARGKVGKLSTSILLMALAVADTSALLTGRSRLR